MIRFHQSILHRASRLSRASKRAIVGLNDAVLAVVASIIAYSLRLGVWVLSDQAVLILIVLALAIFPPVFIANRVYSAIFRYAGRGMMTTIMRAGVIYGVIYCAIIVAASFDGVPRTAGVIQPIVFIGLIFISRLAFRYLMLDLLGRLNFSGTIQTVLIYGAGETGRQIAAAMMADPAYRVIGFVDDDRRMDKQALDGMRVRHTEHLNDIVDKYGVTNVVLAMPRVGRSKRSVIVRNLEALKLKVSTLPPVTDIMAGRVSISDIRDIDVEDLLGRDPVLPDDALLKSRVAGNTVLVTGAGGSIGSELCRQNLAAGVSRLILYDISEFALYSIEHELQELIATSGHQATIVPVLGSVLDTRRLEQTIATHRPHTVFHAAAYKHVPLVEANPVEGLRNNALGTYRTLSAARKGGVSDFILISTDKAVRPTNIMGATKRLAELAAQAFAEVPNPMRVSMVRFGNVLGSSGSVVPLFRKQIRAGGPITLTHRDVTRFFMTIPEAAQLVIQAAGIAKGGEVFVLDMGEPVRIYELAVAMVHLSGLTVANEDDPDGDIAIVEVGLRPGEKLYEELLIGNEPQQTQHPRIMMAREYSVGYDAIDKTMAQIRDLEAAEAAVDLLKAMVSEYQPSAAGTPF